MADTRPSSLLQYLPAIYHEEPFLGRFLLAFELLLFGHDDAIQLQGLRGLEQTAAGIATYFDPYRAQEDVLPWLASWTAFSLRFDLDIAKQRDFIANIIPLYRCRGTKGNLKKLLQIFTDTDPEKITITDVSTGERYLLVHQFHVAVQLKSALPMTQARQKQIEQIARAIIELERPAHTSFELEVTPTPEKGTIDAQ
jgi:phage tail-like protein